MKKLPFSLYLVICSGAALAEPRQEVFIHTPVDNTVITDTKLLNQSPQMTTTPRTPRAIRSSTPMAGEDRELALTRTIEEAIYAGRWDEVERLLGEYSQLPNFDAVQYVYVWGMVYKHQNRFSEAISLYKQLLAKRPELVYVRLNYAMLLFDNKQFKEAAEQFKLVSADASITPDLQKLIANYQQAMDKAQSWRFDFGANYTQTNNVNNAPDAELASSVIEIAGQRLVVRNDEPMPAHGFHYYISADKKVNVAGNHYITMGAGYSGTTYWDAHAYDLKQVNGSLGYEYRTAKYTLGISGLGLQSWLGSHRYSKLWAIGTSFAYNVSPTQQLSVYHNYLKRRYQDRDDEGYNGQMHQVGVTYVQALPPSWQWFVGSDISQESTQTRYNSSRRVGVRAGLIFNKEDSFGARLDVRYTVRKFEGRPWYVATDVVNRRDRETMVQVSMWHNKLQWKGFLPKLNVRWSNIRSNIPSWYNRRNNEVFMTVEKSF